MFLLDLTIICCDIYSSDKLERTLLGDLLGWVRIRNNIN